MVNALAEKLKAPWRSARGRRMQRTDAVCLCANLWSSRTDLVICNDGFVTE